MKEKAQLSKIQVFVQQAFVFFLLLENRNVVTSIYKKLNKSWSTAGFKPFGSGFPTALPHHTCLMKASNDSADTKSARRGQIHGKLKQEAQSHCDNFPHDGG